MPRFNAEQIPNALAEQMYKELIQQGMFGKDALNDAMPQEFGQFNPLSVDRFQPGSINAFIHTEKPMKYDDTKTSRQAGTDIDNIMQKYDASRMRTLTPPQADVRGTRLPDYPPPAMSEGGNAMTNLYSQMPERGAPKYTTPEMPEVPQQNMQQLMDFYVNGGSDI